MKVNEIINEDVSRRGFLSNLGKGAAAVGLAAAGLSATKDAEAAQANGALASGYGSLEAFAQANMLNPQQKQVYLKAKAAYARLMKPNPADHPAITRTHTDANDKTASKSYGRTRELIDRHEQSGGRMGMQVQRQIDQAIFMVQQSGALQ